MTRSRPRLASLAEDNFEEETILMQQQRRDLCSKRPQTTEERTLNIPIEYESSDDDKASEGGSSADTHSRNSATDLAIASLKPGQLFEDPEFPTGPTALFFRY